jgi:Spy/CpxP family protein refolding chaperone
MKATRLLFPALVILLAAAATPASAQGPYKWWEEGKSRTDLGLSADQSAQIEDIFQSNVPRLKSLSDDLKRLERQLSDFISSDTATEAEVVPQVELVVAARGQLDRTRTLMLFRMRRILTPEQRQRLKALHSAGEQQRRHQSS